MPCFDPIASNFQDIAPKWLCQALNFLSIKDISLIKGKIEATNETLLDWYKAHLMRDVRFTENQERKIFCEIRLKEIGEFINKNN